MLTRAKRWITVLVIGAALAVAWLAWSVLHDVQPLDVRSEAARSAAVVYGTVREDPGRRSLVVEEIWKQPASEAGLTVGSVIPVPQLPRDARPERLVVFLESAGRSGRLQAQTIVAVYHGRLGWPEMSVEDAKALCTVLPSI
jgi:hypothetical protein